MPNFAIWTRDDFGLVSDCGKIRIEQTIPHWTWTVANDSAKPPVAEFNSQAGAMDFAEKLRENPDLDADEVLKMDLIEQPIPQAEVDARNAEFERLRIAHDGA